MKVAIIVPIVGNFGRKGFYHSQEIGLGKELAFHGNEVTVYKCVPVSTMESIQTEQDDRIIIKYIPTKAFGPHGMLNVDLIDKDSDVAFTFSDTQLIIPKLYQYCEKNKIKFIPYVGIAHSFKPNLKNKLMDTFFRMTTLKIYKKVTVVTKTIYARKELEALGVKNCIVAPVGIDFSVMKQDFESYNRNEIREKWGFQKNDVIISFVGRMQPEKHPLELLDIFAKIQRENKKLLMVGKGQLEDNLPKVAKKLGIENQVTFISEVKYDEMWQIHYIADYFVNLRPQEIFGMAIMEAIYYKSCVVALKAPGPNTILNGMSGHYLCDNCDEVQWIITNKNNELKKIHKSKEKLINNFSWSSCNEVINMIFEEE